MISGITKLAITKLDVLDGLKTVKICTGYQLNGKKIDFFPANIEQVMKCKPLYEEFEGWNKINTNSAKLSDLPENAQTYLKFIEEELKTPIAVVSIGPGRKETIEV
jgi:adenylosuccinate synthase